MNIPPIGTKIKKRGRPRSEALEKWRDESIFKHNLRMSPRSLARLEYGLRRMFAAGWETSRIQEEFHKATRQNGTINVSRIEWMGTVAWVSWSFDYKQESVFAFPADV